MVMLIIQPITLKFHMVHDILIRFYLQIQDHMRMLVLIIWPHMLLITMAELMKFQQGICRGHNLAVSQGTQLVSGPHVPKYAS